MKNIAKSIRVYSLYYNYKANLNKIICCLHVAKMRNPKSCSKLGAGWGLSFQNAFIDLFY